MVGIEQERGKDNSPVESSSVDVATRVTISTSDSMAVTFSVWNQLSNLQKTFYFWIFIIM